MMRSWLQFGLGGITTSYDPYGLTTIAPILASATFGKTEPPSIDQMYLMEQRFCKLVRPGETYELQNPVDEHTTISIQADTWPPNSYTVILGATEFQRAADIGNINHDTERTFHFTTQTRASVRTEVWQSQSGKSGRVLVQDTPSTIIYATDAEIAEIEAALLWIPI
jgi:hypothetical protein